MKKMITKIKNHIEYKRKLKLLKIIMVNELTNFVVNRLDYINGFQKLLLTMSETENKEDLQKMFTDFVELSKKTKIANDVVADKDK